ncbi:MAG: hypothetical protein A2V63_11985 [Candidatus Eisenbacteria bacterium RBG_19FT_COMBO_70_11]|nr:MAG: hypothetical protein A2V63_11985 [Candidatus Eisenbacteria bacterium RBG_19FT_COMBO_70_11]
MLMNGGGLTVVAALGISALTWGALSLFSGAGNPKGPSDRSAARPPRAIALDTLSAGQTLAELMAKNGLDPAQIHEIGQVVREYKLPRTFRPGMVVRLAGAPGATPDRLRIQMDDDSYLRLTATDSGWVARKEVVPVVVDTLRLAGRIQSSLWLAELSGEVEKLGEGEFKEFVYHLADVYAWKLDFTRDIRSGDAFRVAIEREVRPNGSVRARRFLAIELRNRGRVLSAIPYTRENGRLEYFDTEGKPLRGAFLRYPVPYRVTSGYTNRRYHPVLKRYRPHQGIDYGAPRGTPVQATASGTVTRAGAAGSFGRLVEIRHVGGIRTRYAHLNAIARGVRVGAVVGQGQVIGRVGASGLATGSHLHYEFLQNGRHRNPLAVQLPSVPALEAAHMPEFRALRDASLALIAAVPMPGETAGDPALAAASDER